MSMDSSLMMNDFLIEIKEEIRQRVVAYAENECAILGSEKEEDDNDFYDVAESIFVDVVSNGQQISVNVDFDGDFSDVQQEYIQLINDNIQKRLDANMDAIANDVVENHMESLTNAVASEISQKIEGRFS